MSYLEAFSVVFGTGLVLVVVGLCTCIKRAKSSVVGPNEDQIKDLEAGDQLSNQAKKLTSNRRLPEIPPSIVSSPDENFNRTVRRDSGQDAYSDLYAQLGNAGDSDRTPLKVPKVEALQSRVSDVTDGGTATPPYAKIKKSNHPYSKIKKKAEREHPYASVRGGDDPQEGDETDTDSYDVIETRRSVTEDVDFNPGTSSGPAPPPRGRRPVTSFELGSGPSSAHAANPRPLSYVPGVDYNPAGGSQLVDGRPGVEVDGPHFSGDSQDSKGYSCITVRESLAVLRAKIAQENLPTRSSRPGALVTRQESMSDPNYATVSEAEYSENLYSAIPDPAGNIYSLSAGGSETYARVDLPPPPVAMAASAYAHDTSQDDIPPEPPSVMSLKHLSLASRQGSMASMLSAASSLNVSMSSPKPERRKANSPLPPPPSPHNGDVYATVNKNRRNSRTLAEHGRTAVKSLEEMYAKVLKRKSASLSRASDASFLSQSESSHRGSLDLGQLDFADSKKGHKKTGSGPSGIGGRRGSADTLGSRQSLGCSLDHLRSFPSLPEEMNYEALKNNLLSDIGYEKLLDKSYTEERGKDPGYERLKERVPDNDPGYEKVKVKDETEDPGYEKVKNEGYDHFRSDHGYEAIEQYGLNSSDPNYETVPGSDPNQEPGYETVSTQGSNYECVNYDDDPRNEMYEELGSTSGREPNYESVKYFGEPPYEQLGSANNYEIVDSVEVESSSVQVPNLSELYSQVNKPSRRKDEAPVSNNVTVSDGAGPSRSDNVIRIEVSANSWTLL